MPQEFIIWETEAGWYGRYETKTQAGSAVGMSGPHSSAAKAASAITADGMGSGGRITAGTHSYKSEGGGGGGGGRGSTTTGPYSAEIAPGGGGSNLARGGEIPT